MVVVGGVVVAIGGGGGWEGLFVALFPSLTGKGRVTVAAPPCLVPFPYMLGTPPGCASPYSAPHRPPSTPYVEGESAGSSEGVA